MKFTTCCQGIKIPVKQMNKKEKRKKKHILGKTLNLFFIFLDQNEDECT